MNKALWKFGTLGALTLAGWVAPACAQTPEIKEKPPLYTYVSFWTIPRAQWPEMIKADAADKPILDKAVASGDIVGYGNDVNLIQRPDGDTHADWWSSMSMAGLLNVSARFDSSERANSPVLQSAAKHWNEIIVSRYYNWRSGSWQNIYTRAALYKLKQDAPEDAVAILSKNLFAPLFERMLAKGIVNQYEIDSEAVQTDAPGMLWIFCLAANADAIDKINAAMRDAVKSNPLARVAFDSMVDSSSHRDYMALANATYK